MRWLLGTVLLLAAFAPAVFGQDEYPQKPTELREIQRQELVNLEKENARALQLHNPSFFRQVYSDDFSGVLWFGQSVDRSKMIDYVQTSGVQYDRVVCSDVNVKMYLDLAAVQSLRTERGTKGSQVWNRQFRILRVYINTPRGWRVVAQQETQIAGG